MIRQAQWQLPGLLSILLDGTLCYRCWIFVGELSSEETEQDGTYTVYLNLETGVVEDIVFLSERGGGNG